MSWLFRVPEPYRFLERPRLPAKISNLITGSGTSGVYSQVSLVTFQELFPPSVIDAQDDAFTSTQLPTAIVATLAVEHNPVFVLGRKMPPHYTAIVPHDLVWL